MPELPSVERARQTLHSACAGQEISSVTIVDDPLVFVPGPGAVTAALSGARIVGTHRRGKHLWCELASGACVAFHLGMTGAITRRGTAVFDYGSTTRKAKNPSPERGEGAGSTGQAAAAWPPPHWKLVLETRQGACVAFTNSRRFGRVRVYAGNPLADREGPIGKLGWDPVTGWPDRGVFGEAVGQQRRGIKALLLDQTFVAGVGNWIADDVLYRARVHPERKANSLTPSEVSAVHEAVPHITALAIQADAETSRLPQGWLIQVRWDRQATTRDGLAVRYCTVAGRTTAIVTKVQLKTGYGHPVALAGKVRKKGQANGEKKKKKGANKAPPPPPPPPPVEAARTPSGPAPATTTTTTTTRQQQPKRRLRFKAEGEGTMQDGEHGLDAARPRKRLRRRRGRVA